MKSPRVPLLMPAVCFAAGIFIGTGPLWAVLSLGALCCVAGRARRWAVCAFCLVLGGFADERRQARPVPELDADSGETLLIEGCVVGAVVSDGVQLRFPLELEPGARALVTLTSLIGETLPEVHYGQRIEATAKVRKPRNFGNPGAFDFAGYLRRSDVYWLASVRGVKSLVVRLGTCGSAGKRAAMSVRDWIVSRIRKLSDEELMPALLVGDNFGVDRVQTADFRRTGTYHAIVVSGLHISVVAGTAIAAMRLLRVPLTVLVGMGSLLAWLYAAVADWQAPVVRSAVGFSLFLLASWFYRRGQVLNLLALTAMVLLAFDPSSLFDPSFQLTFLSVAAIAVLAVPVADLTYGPCREGSGPRGQQFRCEMALVAETFRLRPEWVIRALVPVFCVIEMMCISLCVQLALIVPSIAYFHQVSATAIFANVLVVPALSLAVPVGLAAAITNWTWLARIAEFLVWVGRTTASFWAFAESSTRIPEIPPWLMVAVLLSVSLLAVALIRRPRWVMVVPAISTAALLCVALTWELRPDAGVTEVTAIDVGQGDSIFAVLPDGKTLLIDGGGIPTFDPRLRPRMDIGEDVVSPYLWQRGLRRLDYVAVTHFHDDHAAGLPALIRNFRPREVWTGVLPATESFVYWKVRDAAATVGSRIVPLHAGESRPGVQVLWPPPDAVSQGAARNDDSLVLLVSNGRHKFLLMGDAERTAEARMNIPAEIDMLKAGHHGSRTSTTPELLSIARPLFAFVSAGEGNNYGHPSPVVLRELQQAGVRVLRTDHQGLLQVTSDGVKLHVRAHLR